MNTSDRWFPKRTVTIAILMAIFPAVVGLGIFLAYRSAWLERMIIYLRISLDNSALLIGIFLSALGFALLGAGLIFQAHTNRQVDQMRRQAREERRQFLLRLDHELKNPLTTLQVEIANLGNEVENEKAASGRLAPSFKRLKEQIGRLSNLGIQLRKLAELELHPLEKEPMDLAGLLEELVMEFGGPDETARVELRLPQVPWPLPKVEVDADLIYLAFHNLLSNAVKFARPSDAVQVRAFEAPQRQEVVVEIADNGLGIPDSELRHVWEELYRGKLARGLPGRGLGLALVRAIIERHGGQVPIRSRLNQGTVASVRLPARL